MAELFQGKVLEIYVTSIDYDPKAESSIIFFKQVQNKMRWAAHKHTAAEIIYQRVDTEKENMGLTSWQGQQIKRKDVEIAKNYLNKKEMWLINRKLLRRIMNMRSIKRNRRICYLQ